VGAHGGSPDRGERLAQDRQPVHGAAPLRRRSYGTCGKAAYAATSFRPTGGATLREQVALQDEGGATKYFRKKPGGAWTYVATDGLPRGPKGCAAIPQIPRSLAKAWNDCGRQTGGHSRRSGEEQPSS
jgi:hypothetical protein